MRVEMVVWGEEKADLGLRFSCDSCATLRSEFGMTRRATSRLSVKSHLMLIDVQQFVQSNIASALPHLSSSQVTDATQSRSSTASYAPANRETTFRPPSLQAQQHQPWSPQILSRVRRQPNLHPQTLLLRRLVARPIGLESVEDGVYVSHCSHRQLLIPDAAGEERRKGNAQLNFSISLLVSGNLSSGLPFFSDTKGYSFSALEVSWLLATRATLLAFLLGISFHPFHCFL